VSAAAPQRSARPTRIRVSHIWRDEVMGDQVVANGEGVTVGYQPGCTFVTPKLRLPPKFEILRPGARGYVLTLSSGMGGSVSIGGAEMPVEEFIRKGSGGAHGSEGDFRATPVGPGDWGVIHLDGEGDHTFFFQFVEEEPPLPPPIWVLGPTLAPALAFAIILHGILVTVTFLLKDDGHSFLFPGGRDLMTAYLVERPPEPPPEEKKKPGDDAAGREDLEVEVKKPAATVGDKGRAGGLGEKRAAAPDPQEGAPQVGLNSSTARKLLERAKRTGIKEAQGKAMAALDRATRQLGDLGAGKGSGSGVGDDHGGTGTTRGAAKGGTGGGGKSQQDVVTQKDMDTGGERPGKGKGGRKVKEKVVLGKSSGDFTGGLSKADIERKMRSRAGSFRACYQRQLKLNPRLSGTITLRFTIKDRGGKGVVTRASVVGGKSSLNDKKVENCILRNVRGLTFPAKGGAIVTGYPLAFSKG
jgi:hypothetical protein